MSIALVDCNSFYASCEKVFRPDLRHRPVVVLSNNDGCIVAMSPEAKKLEIPRGIPLFKIRDLIEKHKVTVFSSNYTLYGDMSRRIMNILDGFSDEVEVYSIDEAFLTLGDLISDDLTCAWKIQHKVKQCTGIPVSVGLAESKTLAKIANHMGKKEKGVFRIDHSNWRAVMEKTPVQDIWGIGRQQSLFLRRNGIFTAYQFSCAEDAWVKKHMTMTGLRTLWELRGKPSIELEYEVKDKKAIMSSRSFGQPAVKLEELQEASAVYARDAVAKLTAQNMKAKCVTVYLTTNRFRQEDRQYKKSLTVEFPEPTDYLPDFVKAVKEALVQIYKKGFRYKKTAVYLTELIEKDNIQPDLFRTPDKRKDQILKAVADIQNRFGKNSISCIAPHRGNPTWTMKREKLSPLYTTCWDQLAEVGEPAVFSRLRKVSVSS